MIIYILFVLIFFSCTQPTAISNPTPADASLLSLEASGLGISVSEQDRLRSFQGLTHTDHCSLSFKSFGSHTQESPRLEIERSIRYEGTTTHLTAVSIKVIQSEGCHLFIDNENPIALKQVRLGTDELFIERNQLNLSLSFVCSYFHGSRGVNIRSDGRILADNFSCSEDSTSYLSPEASFSSSSENKSRCAEICEFTGRCTENDGLCQAVTDADCQGSELCTDWGRCSARNGECVATTDSDCQKLKSCELLGQCSARNGECVLAKDSDCQKTWYCTDWGRCSARNGECVATTDADCQKAVMCQDFGLCAYFNGECAATKDKHCAQSTDCAEVGKCFAVNGECAAKQ